jgi:hypothetical protein
LQVIKEKDLGICPVGEHLSSLPQISEWKRDPTEEGLNDESEDRSWRETELNSNLIQ